MKLHEGKAFAKLVFKFQVAFNGLIEGIVHDFSIRIQFGFAIVAIIIAFLFNFTYIEWSIWLLCIAIVISLEFLNSSMEQMMDRLDPSYHVLTKKAKDLGAAAVLVSAIVSLIIGLIFVINHL